ncbi:virulence RhuM family protein [Sulfurospirillum halorespirans]|uniref:Virulence RhuM super family protein n=1 Tax=Sulfurospirillum halorespirans DSM 13726 TaxID=1193502 RepID=A0A1D7TMM3_9BACT|nr:virulence RhuM family protein [Sulfurospirillum halorespirans]AOO66251.1 virulence RhuM super family protein [Sulfurospirillum halorespirans DSM 13726]
MSENNIIIYNTADGKASVSLLTKDGTAWLSQSQLAELFATSKQNISLHIQNIFEEEELAQNSVVKEYLTTASDGKNYSVSHYALAMILAIGFRVRSKRGTQFRQWANKNLSEYMVKGFVMDDERLKNPDGKPDYFDELQNRLREIRLSERFFYQKIKDIYMTSIDYDPKDEKTLEFFKIVQNKLLWAVSSQTAAELIHNRVDVNKPLLGMNSFDKEDKNVTKKDVSIAKNYLNEEEIKLLGLLVEQYLAFAETMAMQQIPMYMKDWIGRLDMVISLNGRELLSHAGKISHEIAKAKSEIEYNKYKEMEHVEQKLQSLKELEEDIKRLR